MEITKKNRLRLSSRLYTRFDICFLFFNGLLLFALFLIIAYPLYYIIIGSFDPKVATIDGIPFIPKEFTLDGYTAFFEHKALWRGYQNSLLYTSVGTVINIFFTVCAAYPLSRKDFYGRNIIMVLFVFTMYFSGGLIPSYLLVVNLKLINTIWALVLPPAISVYNMIIMRTYFMTSIPNELLEAAQIDGCRNFYFLQRIVLPLSKPIIAVLGLFYAVGHWNSYFSALIYIRESIKQPLQLVLRSILILNQFDPTFMETLDPEMIARLIAQADVMRYVTMILASIPMMIIYPFIQRYFVTGVMIGSVKG